MTGRNISRRSVVQAGAAIPATVAAIALPALAGDDPLVVMEAEFTTLYDRHIELTEASAVRNAEVTRRLDAAEAENPGIQWEEKRAILFATQDELDPGHLQWEAMNEAWENFLAHAERLPAMRATTIVGAAAKTRMLACLASSEDGDAESHFDRETLAGHFDSLIADLER